MRAIISCDECDRKFGTLLFFFLYEKKIQPEKDEKKNRQDPFGAANVRVQRFIVLIHYSVERKIGASV